MANDSVLISPILSPVALWRMGVLKGMDVELLRKIINLPKKDVRKRNVDAHDRLLALGKKISQDPKWQKIRGREVEEFLKFRNS